MLDTENMDFYNLFLRSTLGLDSSVGPVGLSYIPKGALSFNSDGALVTISLVGPLVRQSVRRVGLS